MLTGGKRKIALSLVCTVLALSFIQSVYATHNNPSAAFYLPFGRFWELSVGGILSLMTLRPARPSLGHVSSIVGAALLIFAVAMTREANFPGLWAIPAVFGSAILIFAGPNAIVNRWALSNRLMVSIGLISYPLYLWHWPLISYAVIFLGETPDEITRLALLASSFVLAIATYLLIEKPIRFGRIRTAAPIPLFVSLLTVGMVGGLIYHNAGVPSRLANAVHNAANQFVGAGWKWSRSEACLQRHEMPNWPRFNFWFCITNTDSAPDVLVIGNSYANQIYPGLAASLPKRKILNYGTCDAGGIDPDYVKKIPPADACSSQPYQKQRETIDELVLSGSVKYVIMAGLAFPNYPPYAQMAQERISFFEKNGVKVIIFKPHFSFSGDIKSCFGRRFREPNDCTNFTDPGTAEKTFKPLEELLAKKNPNVLFFETNPAFCSNGYCSVVHDGMPMLRDEYHHWSEHASLVVGQRFADWAQTSAPDLLR